jgi:hypothetical protein
MGEEVDDLGPGRNGDEPLLQPEEQVVHLARLGLGLGHPAEVQREDCLLW